MQSQVGNEEDDDHDDAVPAAGNSDGKSDDDDDHGEREEDDDNCVDWQESKTIIKELREDLYRLSTWAIIWIMLFRVRQKWYCF